MSQRQTIITALNAACRTLKKSGGYNLDLGRNVIEWPTTPVEQWTLPALAYMDKDASIERDGVEMGFHQHNLQLEVQAFVTTPEDARKAIEDVTALLWTNRNIGGARWVSLESHEIDQQQAERRIVSARMTFTVTYRTALGAI